MGKRTGLLVLALFIPLVFVPEVANANCSLESSILTYVKTLEKKIDKVIEQNRKLQQEIKELKATLKKENTKKDR
jgi:chaperonin cofactor prefoldin